MHPLSAKIINFVGNHAATTESGRYVKLYNAMLYYIVNLIAFNLLVNNTTDTFVSLYHCFYIRQYVKDHCRVRQEVCGCLYRSAK